MTRVEMHRGEDAVIIVTDTPDLAAAVSRCRELFDHVTSRPDRRPAGPATGFTTERADPGATYEARPHGDLRHP